MTIFTARKRSLRRLCFHRCLSVCLGGSLSKEGSLYRGDLCPGVISVQGISVLEGSLSRGGVSVQERGSLSRRGDLCQGVSVQKGLCLGVSVRETPRMVTSG